MAQAQQVALPTEEEGEEAAAEARVVTYDYLLSMPIASLTAEKARGAFAHVLKSSTLALQPREAALATTERGSDSPGGGAARQRATGARGGARAHHSAFPRRPPALPAVRLIVMAVEQVRAREQPAALHRTARGGRRRPCSSAHRRARSAVPLAAPPHGV